MAESKKTQDKGELMGLDLREIVKATVASVMLHVADTVDDIEKNKAMKEDLLEKQGCDKATLTGIVTVGTATAVMMDEKLVEMLTDEIMQMVIGRAQRMDPTKVFGAMNPEEQPYVKKEGRDADNPMYL